MKTHFLKESTKNHHLTEKHRSQKTGSLESCKRICKKHCKKCTTGIYEDGSLSLL